MSGVAAAPAPVLVLLAAFADIPDQPREAGEKTSHPDVLMRPGVGLRGWVFRPDGVDALGLACCIV